MEVIKMNTFKPNFNESKILTLWKLLHPNDLYFTAELTAMKWEMCPYACESLWILFLFPQSQDPIYCHTQKNKQFFNAVMNHLFIAFAAECVWCTCFPSTFLINIYFSKKHSFCSHTCFSAFSVNSR